VKPLNNINVIEMAGLAPSPYCGMILSDFGADVTVVDRLIEGRPEIPNVMKKNPFHRGKRIIRINLKTSEGMDILKKMVRNADILIEAYRPGVMEKLGLGPGEAESINGRLIYARLTGWGQEGPYADMAGHDINYIALSGALSLFKREKERPLPPCNLIGDFAGGSLFCSIGILLALIERNSSNKGQVVDSAMIDGAAHLSTFFYGLMANRLMTLDIGTNMVDGGAPYYQVYATADGQFMAVGAVEKRFYKALLEGMGLSDNKFLSAQNDVIGWPKLKKKFTDVFKTKTRAEWTKIFEGKDACVTPVLKLDEVLSNPHNKTRNLLTEIDGMMQPSPAPRLSRTPGGINRSSQKKDAETEQVLIELRYNKEEIQFLFDKNIVE